MPDKPPKEFSMPPPHVVDQMSLRERMELIYMLMKAVLPPKYFFFVFTGPFGEDFEGKSGNYTSNANRQEMTEVMVEFLRRNRTDEDWMKHLDENQINPPKKQKPNQE